VARGPHVHDEQYHSTFVEPGPLPPHERTWRHPSELGPTSGDVDATTSFGPHTKMLAAASGVLAFMLVVAIVVTATPDRSDAPTALSATTTPVVAFSSSTLRPAETPRHTIAPAQALLLVSLTAIPNEIASAPQLSQQLPAVADRLPKSSEAVMVQTADVTYHCTWADVALLEMPDGTMVVDGHGDLVAQVDEGEVVALVEDTTTTSSEYSDSSVASSID
jgi:hypothetical protein